MAFIIRLAGPNEALVRSGGGARPKVKVGGRLFVIPVFQKAQRISLEVLTLQVNTPKVDTNEGVALPVGGVAQVEGARGEYGTAAPGAPCPTWERA